MNKNELYAFLATFGLLEAVKQGHIGTAGSMPGGLADEVAFAVQMATRALGSTADQFLDATTGEDLTVAMPYMELGYDVHMVYPASHKDQKVIVTKYTFDKLYHGCYTREWDDVALLKHVPAGNQASAGTNVYSALFVDEACTIPVPTVTGELFDEPQVQYWKITDKPVYMKHTLPDGQEWMLEKYEYPDQGKVSVAIGLSVRKPVTM